MSRPVEIRLETDLIADAADDLRRVRAALAKRHGAPFRALERRIEALGEAGGLPDLHPLSDDSTVTLLATPPKEWLDILAEARRLGVI
jgi:hypothetical protein